MRIGKIVAFAGVLLQCDLKAQISEKVIKDFSSHYQDRTLIREFQVGSINTETENYQESAKSSYNNLFSSYGLGNNVSYEHSGPYRHHLMAFGGKFIYGRYYSPTASQTLLFEGMYGKNYERNPHGKTVYVTDVYGVSVAANADYKWVGGTLGFSAGKFIPRNDESVNYFSAGRFSVFDIFGRWKVRVLPHRWFFFEYSHNDLFLFHGGQGELTQIAAGTGFGLMNGSELKVGLLKFLNTSGKFIESTLYFRNKFGAGVNYTVYDKGSNYTSFKLSYRLAGRKF